MVITVTTVAGWELYLNVFSPDETEVWVTAAFVTDSAANRNAGAIEGVESPSGFYSFVFPAEITTAGDYPFQIYRQLGVEPDSATDTVVAPSSFNFVTVDTTPAPAPTPSDLATLDTLSQTLELSADTDAVIDFTMDPAPQIDGVYGIAGWTIEVRLAKNIGDEPLLTLSATVQVVGDESTASIFRVTFATEDLEPLVGETKNVYRFQAFRTDAGSRDVLAGARLVLLPIILS